MIKATEARGLAITQHEINKFKVIQMVSKCIRMCAEDGRFSTRVQIDNMITNEILRDVSALCVSLGYKCKFIPDSQLEISWDDPVDVDKL